MSTNPNQPPVKDIVEAALLAATEPVPVERLLQLFPEDERPAAAELRDTIARLAEEWAERPLELRQVGSGYRFQVRQRFAPWIGRLSEERPPRYSRALLETLALIVYRQPITRAGIEEIRGVAVSQNIIRTLLEREWIRVVGHRDVPGKPALFGTTKKFLDYFNLGSLSELPALADIRPLDDPQAALEFDADGAGGTAPAEGAGADGRDGEAADSGAPDVPGPGADAIDATVADAPATAGPGDEEGATAAADDEPIAGAAADAGPDDTASDDSSTDGSSTDGSSTDGSSIDGSSTDGSSTGAIASAPAADAEVPVPIAEKAEDGGARSDAGSDAGEVEPDVSEADEDRRMATVESA